MKKWIIFLMSCVVVFFIGCETQDMNVKTSALNYGDEVTIPEGPLTIWIPGRPMTGFQLMVANAPIRDSYGNTAAGSFVCVLQNNGQFVFRGGATYWPSEHNVPSGIDFSNHLKKYSVNNKLVISAPVSLEQMLRSRDDIGNLLKSQALLCPAADGKLEFVMEHDGDYIAIPNRSTTPIGVGSQMRFCADKWVDFLGAKYRKGGFKVTQQGIKFDESTEKQDNGKLLKYQNGQWMPIS